jgi:hypothetical protein
VVSRTANCGVVLERSPVTYNGGHGKVRREIGFEFEGQRGCGHLGKCARCVPLRCGWGWSGVGLLQQVAAVALFPYRHPNEHKKNPPPHTWRPSALPPSANGSFSINRKLATPFSLKLNKKIFLFFNYDKTVPAFA